MRIVAALGGNALLERGERPDAGIQQRHVRAAAAALAPLAAEHELIVCHGNGPQVGLLAMESEADSSLSQPYPLDAIGAQTQGLIGYWLAQALRNAGVADPVVNVITQTVVDPADAAFRLPDKFVGAVYSHSQAVYLAARHGWDIARDGDRWRRVVASPEPVGIVELPSIAGLVSTGAVVICGGGGGVPVVSDHDELSGVEAVVDKDLTAALLAVRLRADRLLVLTDVPALMRDFGTPHATALAQLDLDEATAMRLPAGSMGPKVSACARFVAATGRPATIGALGDAAALLAGTAGTTITPASAARGEQPGAAPVPDSTKVGI
jgi:carbamate kinase